MKTYICICIFRLQPSAMVNSSICAVCDHNRPGATCQRDMEWVWRGEYSKCSQRLYENIYSID